LIYKIKTEKKTFCIWEIPTSQVIYRSFDEKLVKDICKLLNAGGGFEGYTPAFFGKK